MAKISLGERFGKLAGGAGKKSGALMETARLNTEINRLLADMEDIQFELGRAYYEDHKTKSTGPYIEYIQRINHMENEIHTRNEKLLSKKGLQYCENCGAVVADEDEFCSKCATPVPRNKWKETSHSCRNCGEPVEEGQGYCLKCGIRLEQPE